MNRADFLPSARFTWTFTPAKLIPGIGADFDPDEFADTLAKAHVNSITCFARCHHGWIYYESQALTPSGSIRTWRGPTCSGSRSKPATRAGIRVPIYTTIQWDHFTAREHPEWLLTEPDGRIVGTPPFEAGFYR